MKTVLIALFLLMSATFSYGGDTVRTFEGDSLCYCPDISEFTEHTLERCQGQASNFSRTSTDELHIDARCVLDSKRVCQEYEQYNRRCVLLKTRVTVTIKD